MIFFCWFQSSSDHITVDWLPEELFRAREKTAGKQDGGGRLVEQLECPVVDRDLIHLMAIQMFTGFNGPPKTYLKEELGGCGDST